MILPEQYHDAFRDSYGAANEHPVSAATWTRAQGWALALALAFLANSADNPLMADIGQRTVDAVLRQRGLVAIVQPPRATE
jgi:hypothetical protein